MWSCRWQKVMLLKGMCMKMEWREIKILDNKIHWMRHLWLKEAGLIEIRTWKTVDNLSLEKWTLILMYLQLYTVLFRNSHII